MAKKKQKEASPEILVWQVKQVKVRDLIPNEFNPRTITAERLERLQDKIKRLGFNQPVKLDHDGTLLGGNKRYRSLMEQGLGDLEIPAMVPPRKLTEKERQEIIISDNVHEGAWDFDMLADHFELEDLKAWGLEDLPSIDSEESIYTSKIEAPIYEPKGENPPPSQLYDFLKATQLIQEIERSNVSPDVKRFLILAAHRHVVFNYQKIAEFYAHADKTVQDLMEKSALVVIDYKKAIEYGFVEMTKEIAEGFNAEAQL